MLPAVGLPKFVTDYLWSCVLASVVAVLTAVFLLIRRVPGWFRSARAAGWLISQGTVENVNVKTVSGQALGELAYSYMADGERYSGYLLLQFADEQDAWDTIDPLKGQSLFVRYEPGNPVVSAVRRADQTFLFSKHEGSFVGRLFTRQVLEALGWDWKRWARWASWNWPVAKGRVESAPVTQHRDGATWFLFPDYTAEVRYSYCVGSEYYSGYILRSFFRESSAKEFVESLKDKGVFVRYSQSSPSISVLRMRDQQTLQLA